MALVDDWRCGAAPPTAVRRRGTAVGADEARPAASRRTTRLPESITGSWLRARAPGTVAGALRDAGLWTPESEEDLDTHDWVFVTEFAAAPVAPGERCVLEFDGLGALCTVLFNDVPLGTVANTLHAWDADVTTLLREQNRLVVHCHALAANLDHRGTRARWRTALVERGGLRAARVSLLGRMPGWWPRAPLIGPWRAVRLVREHILHHVTARVRASLDGVDGVVTCAVSARRADDEVAVHGATLTVGAVSHALTVDTSDGTTLRIDGALRVADAPRWWPHTHGEQPLFDAVLELATSRGAVRMALGRIGFRHVATDAHAAPGFGLCVNDVPVFCRGPVWMPLDIASPGDERGDVRAILRAWRDAGANMVRIPGLSAPERDAFHAACDELGLLVWQDAMFASMDYPSDDRAFVASCETEVQQLAARLAVHPSTAVLCGSSEVAQQAAFMGRSPEEAVTPLFTEWLAGWVRAVGLDVPYVPSSPWGGLPPTRTDVGVTHYYGVGAYRRPLDDARRASVRFAAECLGVSHMPDEDAIDWASARDRTAWQLGVPRDPGASWDFADVREHYQRLLEGDAVVDARDHDPVAYRAHARWTTAAVLHACFREWRRAGSPCRGALVWLSHDVRPGPGWGVRDHRNAPKEAFRALADVWQPLAVVLTDEGQSGLAISLLNEQPHPFVGTLSVTATRADGVVERDAHRDVRIAGHGVSACTAEEVLGEFLDIVGAYRFGPPRVQRVDVVLRRADSTEVVASATWPPWPVSAVAGVA